MRIRFPFQKSDPKKGSKPPEKGKDKGKDKSKDKGKGKEKDKAASSAGSASAAKSKPKAGGKPAAHPTPAPPPLPPLFNLSDERKLDVLGVFLALVGIVGTLTTLSANRSEVTESLLSVMALPFGWGTFVLCAALILFGVWLVVRKIDRVPPISVERVTGLGLLFLLIETALQKIGENPPSPAGGGWVGSLLYNMLQGLLGDNGLILAMVAWFLISLIMAFDLTLPELFAKIKPLMQMLAALWGRVTGRIPGLARSGSNSPQPASASGALPPTDGYTPLKTAAPASVSAAPEKVGVPTTTVGKPVEWILPKVKDILELGTAAAINQEFTDKRARLIEETLGSFGAPAQVVEINRGPTITQFGVEPMFMETRAGRTRVRVSKIVSLADDLALALAAQRIRIQAPVPGHSYVGIEVPNSEMSLVTLRDLLESEIYQRNRKALSFALGQDVAGHPAGADLAAMPHMLIAGATGSGKSVCVNAILTCLLLYNTPEQLRLILVDPKRVELTGYNGIPHLLAPVVVEMDKVVGALQWMTREMDRRYQAFAQVGSRNIQDYNARMKTQGQKPLPFLVVVIDELADLMMIAPDETERTITRLAQLARATGIHLILATQRPSVDVVTGLIKANFPARIAFAVASNMDSRVILDQPGAERLLGRGDMLYQAPDAPSAARLQGVFVSDGEIHRLVDFWKAQNTHQSMPTTPGGPVDAVPSNVPLKQGAMFEDMSPVEKNDPLYTEAVDLVRREGRASVSMLQRRMRIGYTRAARLIDTMEEKKIVGQPQDATGVRPVLDYGQAGPPKET